MFFGGWFSKRPVSWHSPAIIVQFRPVGGTMGKTGFIVAFVGLLVTGAAAAPPVTTISQVLAALDQGDALAARRLSDVALERGKPDAAMRARLLLYRGLAAELLSAHDSALRDLTQAIDT